MPIEAERVRNIVCVRRVFGIIRRRVGRAHLAQIPDAGGDMSTISSTVIAAALIAAAVITPSVARAQVTPVEAPVSSQILNARRAFVSNAGSDSYGAESYFRLTKYDGGPDRVFHQFYSALKRWGKYELVDTPIDADIVFAVRFTSPIVDKAT
jgi:hypothetical protein